jgi:hypothetical protein
MTRAAFEAFKLGQGKQGISPWVCSDDDGMMYFYSTEKIKEEYGIDFSDECVIPYGIDNAYSSASIQAAINGESEIVVLCLDLSDVHYSPDYSCENMAYIADCADCDSVNISHVVKAYSMPYNQFFAAFTLVSVYDNPLFNIGGIPKDMLEAVSQLRKAGIYLEYETPRYTLINI